MKKIVYIAGIFMDANKLDNLKKMIEEETDYVVPCVWWEMNAKEFQLDDDNSWFDLSIVHEFFQRDISAIDNCDIFLIKFSGKKRLYGALVELGYAYAMGKRTIAVGPKERSCMLLSVGEWYQGVGNLIDALKGE